MSRKENKKNINKVAEETTSLSFIDLDKTDTIPQVDDSLYFHDYEEEYEDEYTDDYIEEYAEADSEGHDDIEESNDEYIDYPEEFDNAEETIEEDFNEFENIELEIAKSDDENKLDLQDKQEVDEYKDYIDDEYTSGNIFQGEIVFESEEAESDYYEDDNYEDDNYEEDNYEEDNNSNGEDDIEAVNLEVKKKKPNQNKGIKKKQSKDSNLSDKIKDFFAGFSTTEIGLIAGGILVFVMLIVVVVSITLKKTRGTAEDDYASGTSITIAELGEELSSMGIAGEVGLQVEADNVALKINALAEAEAAEEAEELAREEEERKKAEAAKTVDVTFTSFEKDLKVKFITAGTDYLVKNVEFEIKIKSSSGKEQSFKDSDKDGIIYEKNVSAGDYSVEVIPVDGYTFTDYAKTVNVKDRIVYKQVDVAQEIKKEAEVNVAAEDTGIKNVQAEAEATAYTEDTVKWVESSKSADDGGYTRIEKKSIAEPSYAMRNTIQVNMPVLSASPSYLRRLGNNVELRVLVRDPENNLDDKEIEDNKEEDTEEEDKEDKQEENTVKEKKADLSLGGNQEIAVGDSRELEKTAKCDGNSLPTSAFHDWSSSDTSIVTVDNGKITAKKEGNATISVKYDCTITEDGKTTSYTGDVSIKVTVKKEESKKTIKELELSKKSTSLAVDKTETISATAILSDDSKITDSEKFTYESSDEKVAKVSSKGVITAVKKGEGSIKVTYKDEEGNTKSATLTVKVVENAESDTSSKLKDKDGNQVYIKNSDGKYVEAVFADYYKEDEFYIANESEMKYTGWQTINGKVYFFDENGKKVTGEQTIQGITYKFDSDGALASNSNGAMGIDVSKWNGTIDWNAVKNSGISFVIIRCGYRGSTSGALIEDSRFKSNIQGAQAAGLRVGIYFFTQAVNEAEAVEEASMVLSLIRGYSVSYPVFIDTEKSGGRGDRIDKATRTAVCVAFCETIKNGGYTPGVYASKSWYNDNLNYGAISGYRIWLAQYASKASFSNRYDMWQYSEKGSVSGISGKTDLNISYF